MCSPGRLLHWQVEALIKILALKLYLRARNRTEKLTNHGLEADRVRTNEFVCSWCSLLPKFMGIEKLNRSPHIKYRLLHSFGGGGGYAGALEYPDPLVLHISNGKIASTPSYAYVRAYVHDTHTAHPTLYFHTRPSCARTHPLFNSNSSLLRTGTTL